jgi:chromate transporter
MQPANSGGTAREVLAASMRLGLTSFGGPIAHLGYFRREYVERRRWLDEARYADLVALSQLLPGPASSQVGIAIGTLRAGRLGGIAAWIGFTLPSALAMILFGLFTRSFDLSSAGWVHGLKLVAVAVVAQAVCAMARTLTPDSPRILLALVAAAVAIASPSPQTQIAVIVAGAVVGLGVLRPTTASPPIRSTPTVPRALGIAALALFVVLLLGLPLARSAEGQPVAMFDSFYRAGSLVFGGGHVVLPLLH